jgi:hypothetical protein
MVPGILRRRKMRTVFRVAGSPAKDVLVIDMPMAPAEGHYVTVGGSTYRVKMVTWNMDIRSVVVLLWNL